MSQTKIQPVIMSGGAGTRLWPMSRNAHPKQFLPLLGQETLFQASISRFSGDSDFLAPLVITGGLHTDLVRDQLDALGVTPAAIIVEPMARNTAAVAAVAAKWTLENRDDALVLLAPADHHITDAAGFRDCARQGASAAQGGKIVTFGIAPDEPHTGFGYIEKAAVLDGSVFAVEAFHEKPDRPTAEQYFASGKFFWNAGIFLFSPKTMLGEINRFGAGIKNAAVAALTHGAKDGPVITLSAPHFEESPSESIDYCVMEKTDRAAVIAPVDVGWSDIGSWTALEPLDDDKITTIDCQNTLVRTDGPFVGAIGLEDMIVVATKDAVLVAPKSRAQDVKRIIEEIKTRNRTDLL